MRRMVLPIIVLLVLISGCLGDVRYPHSTSSPVVSHSTEPHFTPPMTKYDVLKEGQEDPIVEAVNSFAFDLYKELAKDEGNLFFSPFSIETALAMAYEGASGKTAEEMERVLYLPEDNDTRWVGFRYLILSLKSPEGSSFILRSANALWVQRDHPISEKYLWVVGEFYLGEAREVDFQGDPQGAAKEINAWVENQTSGRIRNIVSDLSPMRRLVITNAIYFKANWSSRFEASNTRNETFHAPNETVIVPMMHQTGRFPYFENDDLQALELPYEGERLSMLIILPRKGKFEKVEGNLSVQFVENILENMHEEKVKVALPKFRFEASYKLRDVLMDMGMKSAFLVPDFEGISNDGNLAISEVIHKSFISVAENGTEAAAATAVTLTLAAPSGVEKPKVFKADHPFIFLIYDRESDTILFMGRLANPKG
ncbi:serpin family protein [Thermococcus alcaliphilus]|uniref:serpin family protein n=1 Tax=Thermococcus alcaliphilus TaxID=139207 RepID=UPI002090C6E5|nr:serpin family protein [Thermococcus alcaliphilus]MCO6040280.1 serpin family protein [Thermococcus alcaliphilus]